MMLLGLMQQRRGQNFGRSDFEMPLWNANSPGYPISKKRAVRSSIAEAWQWLENEGLVIADPEQPNGFFCLTRKGATLKSDSDVEAYRYGNLLPEAVLHPNWKGAAHVSPRRLRRRGSSGL